MSSIRSRLTLGLGLVCVVLWSAGGLVLYLTLRDGLIAEFDHALGVSAHGLASLAEESGGEIVFDSAGELMPTYERVDRPDYFEIWRSDGSALARSPSLDGGELPGRFGPVEDPQCWNLTLPDGLAGRAAGIRFVPAKDEDPPDAPPARETPVDVVDDDEGQDEGADDPSPAGGASRLAGGVPDAASPSGAPKGRAEAAPEAGQPRDVPVAPPASGGRPGEAMLVIARHRTDLDRRLHQLAMTLFVVGSAASVATALLAAVVVRRGLKPLSSLAGRVASMDASSLQLRVPTDGMPSELLPIGGRLNDLFARLEDSFARERRFSADVAHELRTPIAELRALAEVALKWPEDADANRGALQEALGISLQMESIATGLLALARCEGGLLSVRPEPVCLGPLIREIWKPLAPQAAAKHLSVTLSTPDGTSWVTDPVALRAILVNLLSNAVEYSPDSGAVSVRVESNHGGGQVLVSNTTSHLGADDLPHLFERLWRKDAARSSSVHSGLGLALAKAYADSLGLRLRAELVRPNELTIELSAAGTYPPG